jgi:hypothetical protein
MRTRALLLPLLVVLSLLALVSASSALADFGFQSGSVEFNITNRDGSAITQAGSHPYQVVTKFALNSTANAQGERVLQGDLKDFDAALPQGLVGDPRAVPQCTAEQFAANSDYTLTACPDSTQVGVALVETDSLLELVGVGFGAPIWNLVPPPGVPAEFGFEITGVPVLLTPTVRSNGDYGLTVSSDNTSQGLNVFGAQVAFWGVPGDPGHNEERGECLKELPAFHLGETEGGSCPAGIAPVPFLRMPTSCTGPFTTVFSSDSWPALDASSVLQPSVFVQASVVSHETGGAPVGLDGCNQLPFKPSFTVAQDTSAADSPAGLTFDLKIPQEGLLAAEGLATSDLKDTTVTLPEGVAVNPGQAAGLVACQPSEDGVGIEGPPTCPSASQVGTVQITTPLLENKLEGDVYVLQSNPPDLKLLVAAASPVDGVYVKLVGDVHLDESTGRLTTTFTNTPQLPFSDLKLSFSGGAQAALTTPPKCGLYTTTSDFAPWSGQPDSTLANSFAVETGPGGSACAATLPFAPTLHAGATTDQAGGYTNFSLLLQRGDGQQRISTLQFKTPKGLLGMISKIPLCGEAQANAGTCPAASEIGHTVVQAGPGPFPLVVPQPGQPPAPIYLTGGYDGAPYGLSVVVPVVAGPFTLQTQVVRAKIEVDPHTAQLTVTTNPLPPIIDGVPTDLRTVDAVIDRPGFMFNPTNCSPQAFSGTAASTEGAQAAISSPFQVGSCQSLAFKPDFKVTTSAKTSKADGASLTATITYPTTTPGTGQATSEANIALVKVDLPKQLPSRLTTLQKACLAKVFEANPANCPKESVVGHATATTPVLPVALNGPAYFVSHGGEAFPSLIVVLQGYGVTVDLVGTTFISKAGITSSTFKQVPDVPVGSFEITLPQGKFSALAANLPAKAKGSFCGQKLTMPTAFTAQNGAVLKQSTKIGVAGCPARAKAKKAKKKQKHKKSTSKQKGRNARS